MPFNEIGNIKIDGNNPGEAYGGHIYSSNISIGDSSTPTTLTINVVHQNGVTTEVKDQIKKDIEGKENLNDRDEEGIMKLKKIEIGDLDPIYMYLIKYEVRKSIGSSVLTLQYTDGSILLDKIFVGLVNRHASKNSSSLNSEINNIEEYETNISLDDATVNMSVNCLACDGKDQLEKREAKEDGIYDANGQKIKDANGKNLPPITRKIEFASPSKINTKANYFFVPNKVDVFRNHGGAIIMGRENFTENPCDVPDVDYTFQDLLEAFKHGFISVKDVDNVSSLVDKTYENDYSPYRKDYTGTLREVLNAWCADFGYSFTWNIYKPEPEVIGVSLTTAITSISKIKKAVESIKSAQADKTVVESAVESYSKEGTYKQAYISQYIKGARVKEKNEKKYAVKMFYNLPVELIMSPAQWNSRPLARFIAHAGLAKYSPEVRRSVLWGEADGSAAGNASLATLGYSGVQRLTQDQKHAVVAEWEFDQVNSIIDQFGENFTLSVGYYNEEVSNYWQSFDASIADGFLGRYYFRPVLSGELDEKGCIEKAAFNHSTTMVGGGSVQLFDWISPESCFRFPYARFIGNATAHQARLGVILPYLRNREGNDGLKQDAYPPEFIDKTTGEINTSFQTPSNIVNEAFNYKNGIWIFEREAAWGTSETEFTNKFTKADGGSAIQHLLPQNLPLEGRALNIFQDILVKVGGASSDSRAVTQKVLIIGPPPGKAGNCYTNFGSEDLVPRTYAEARFDKRYYNRVRANYNEQVSLSVQDRGGNLGTGSATATAEDCQTLCELNLVESICGTCNINDEVNRPYVGFTHFAAYDSNSSGDVIPRGTISEYYSVKFPSSISRNSGMFVTLPSMQDYQGYLELSVSSRSTVDGAKDIYGSVLPVEKNNDTSHSYKNSTLGIKVVENNITNDVDKIVDPDTNENIIKMLVPENLLTKKGNLKSIKPVDYHKEIEKYFNKGQMGVNNAQEEYSFSLAGLKFKDVGLDSFLHPEKGLRSININYDEKGITSSFVFSTRPAVLPNPMTFMKSLGPKLNTYGR